LREPAAEGDTIFRTARALGRALAGKPVTVFRSTYPLLTRFNDDSPIPGQLVERVEARGKWLLIHFSGGGTLATHMLMSGSWHIYRHGERWQQPRTNMRIVLENSDYIAVGFRVPVAEMHTAQSLARDRRIPNPEIDVLSPVFNAAAAARRVQAHASEEIADVLLHQEVLAGVGTSSSRRFVLSPASIHFAKSPRSARSKCWARLPPRKNSLPPMCWRIPETRSSPMEAANAAHARVRSRRQPVGLRAKRRAMPPLRRAGPAPHPGPRCTRNLLVRVLPAMPDGTEIDG